MLLLRLNRSLVGSLARYRAHPFSPCFRSPCKWSSGNAHGNESSTQKLPAKLERSSNSEYRLSTASNLSSPFKERGMKFTRKLAYVSRSGHTYLHNFQKGWDVRNYASSKIRGHNYFWGVIQNSKNMLLSKLKFPCCSCPPPTLSWQQYHTISTINHVRKPTLHHLTNSITSLLCCSLVIGKNQYTD